MPLPDLINKFANFHFRLDNSNNGYIKKVYPEKEFFRIIENERERANRNKHQFSLIIFDLGMPGTDTNTKQNFLKKITQRVRLIDEIGRYGPKRVGIVLPYTSANGAREFADSLDDLLQTSIPISICTIYTYPSKNDVD